MISIKRKMLIRKPVKDVWKVIFERFTHVEDWVTGVYTSRPGTKEEEYDRVCTTFTGKLYETILDKDEKNHKFVVDAKGLPFFVKTFRGVWQLKEIDKKTTEAVLELRIETKGIIGAIMKIPLKSNLEKGLKEIQNDLITFVETGKISKAKQKEKNKSNK